MATGNTSYTDDQQITNETVLHDDTLTNDIIEDDRFETNPAQVLLLASGLLHNFVTRTDNYSVQTSYGNYFPQNEELTLSVIQDHIDGRITVGAYSLDQDNQVKHMTLDIDLAKSMTHQIEEFTPVLADTAKRVVTKCRAIGIEPILEFSGFKGYHVTVLFEELIPAVQAMRLGASVVKRVGKLPEHIRIEIYPKQDALTPNRPLGNLVKLPLALHKVSKQRSQFLNADTFQPVDDTLEFLRNAPKTAAKQVLEIVGTVSETKRSVANRPKPFKRLDRTGLLKMVENCPVIRKFEANPAGWTYDQWLGLASAYIEFESEGGWDRFVEFSKKDSHNFDQEEIDRIHAEVLNFDGCQSYRKFREQGVEFEMPPSHIHCPVDWAREADELMADIHEVEGRYVRYKKIRDDNWVPVTLTDFILEPTELLELETGDVLQCVARTATGREFPNVRIQNTDWLSRTKLLTAIGHSECTATATDVEIQKVCAHVLRAVKVRKQGTPMIGLHGDLWVIGDANYNAVGKVDIMQIVPFDKSKASIHNSVSYTSVNDANFKSLAKTLFPNLVKLNEPGVILPVLGWYFAAPLKPRIKELVGAFPILFCNGTMGGGKTSLIRLMQTMSGYSNSSPNDCKLSDFAMKKLLSSTNAIPVFFDEYKPSQLKNEQISRIMTVIRQTYGGEVISKGRPDQTLQEYRLEAPLVLCGEASTDEPAVLERSLMPGFKDTVKQDKSMQASYKVVKEAGFEGLMERYVPFCLSQDLDYRWKAARLETDRCLSGLNVNPRIVDNLTTMVMGLQLMIDFAGQWNVNLVHAVDIPVVIAAQVEEITGSTSGQVKLAADIFLEQLGRASEKDDKIEGFAWTEADLRDRGKKYLCIHLPSAIDSVKRYSTLVGYKGDILDENAYKRQFRNRPYFVEDNRTVRFQPYNFTVGRSVSKRAVVLDIEKAKEEGIELGGLDF